MQQCLVPPRDGVRRPGQHGVVGLLVVAYTSASRRSGRCGRGGHRRRTVCRRGDDGGHSGRGDGGRSGRGGGERSGRGGGGRRTAATRSGSRRNRDGGGNLLRIVRILFAILVRRHNQSGLALAFFPLRAPHGQLQVGLARLPSVRYVVHFEAEKLRKHIFAASYSQLLLADALQLIIELDISARPGMQIITHRIEDIRFADAVEAL